MVPKSRIIGFGGRGHFTRSGNHENDDFSGFPKVKSKSG